MKERLVICNEEDTGIGDIYEILRLTLVFGVELLNDINPDIILTDLKEQW